MNNFTARLHQFHTHLLLGKAGSTVLGYADLVLLFLTGTGLILWGPRNILAVNWRSPSQSINFDLHQCPVCLFLHLSPYF